MKRQIAIMLVLTIFCSAVSLSSPGGDSLAAEGESQESETISNPVVDENGVTWDCIYFGNYWQNDTNGDGKASQEDAKEPIKWRVLSIKDKEAMIMSDKCLDTQAYSDHYGFTDWEESYIRKWLNKDFYNNAFSPDEKTCIQISDVKNNGNVEDYAKDGNNTRDKIFLLSVEELKCEEYGFPAVLRDVSENRVACNTEYAKDIEGSWNVEDNRSSWYLRTPVKFMGMVPGVATVFYYGQGVVYDGMHTPKDVSSIRPVLRIDLSNSSLWDYAGTVSSNDLIKKPDATSDPDYSDLPSPSPSQKPDNISGFSMGDGVSIDVGNDVPFLGGGKIKLDLGDIPILYEDEGEKFRMGIGCQNLTEPDWINLRKFVEKQNENYIKGIQSIQNARKGIASLGWKNDLEISLCGYAEGTKDGDKLKSVEGKAVVSIKGKFKKEEQHIVYVVPVVLKLKGEVGIENTYAVGLDFSKRKVYLNGDMELTLPKITISAGVGVAYVGDVSVYGTADNKIRIDKNDHVTGKLTGEVGISAKFLFASYKKSLLKDAWKYYDSENGAKKNKGIWEMGNMDADSFQIERQDGKVVNQRLRERNTGNTPVSLTENGYHDMQPKIVSLDNKKKMLVYTASRSDRTTGNHTAVCYRIYDEETAQWSNEKLVDNDSEMPTADFYPDVVSDGTHTYVVWSDTCCSDFSEATPLEDVASACEIKVAEYDQERECFEEPEVLTKNQCADLRAKVIFSNGAPMICWIQNEGDNILQMSGKNTIMLAEMKEGKWDVTKVKTLEKPLREMRFGMQDTSVILYSLDEDKDLSTSEDCELYLLGLDGKGKKITNNNLYEENPQFSAMKDEVVITWYVEGEGIYKTRAGEKPVCIIEDDEIVSSNYQWLPSDGADSTLLCSSSDGKDSHLYGYFSSGEAYGGSVPFTNMEGYIGAISGCEMKDGYGISFVNTNVQIENDDVKENFDLCFLKLQPYTNILIKDVEYLEENILPGKDLEVKVRLVNSGIQSVESSKIAVTCNGKRVIEKTITGTMQPGEERIVILSVPLPEDMTSDSVFQFYAETEKDVLEFDNNCSLKMGKPDFELEINDTEGKTDGSIRCTVSNHAPFSSTAVLQIRKKDSEGEIVKEFSLGELSPDSSQIVEIPEDVVGQLAGNGDTLYFQIESESEEQFYFNNSAFVNVEGLSEKPAETKLPVSEMTSTPMPSPSTEGEEASLPTLMPENTPTSSTPSALPPASTSSTIPSPGTSPIRPSASSAVPVLSPSPQSSGVTSKPFKVKALRVKAKKRAFRASWKKQPGISGYQIQYARNKKITKSRKSRLVKRNTVKIKKLRKNKKYFIRVRAYKMHNGKGVFGKWSKVKTVKIK